MKTSSKVFWLFIAVVILANVIVRSIGEYRKIQSNNDMAAMKAVVTAHNERMKGIDQSVNTDTVWSKMTSRQSAIDAVRKLQAVQAEEDRLENELSNVFASTGMNEGKMPMVIVNTGKAERDWSASAIEAMNCSVTLDDSFWNTPPSGDRFARLDPGDRATIQRLMKHADEAANAFIAAADAQRKYFNLPAKQR
jgi:hypothetical protein